MNRLSISKEKVKKSIGCSTGSKKRASPTFENPPAAEDEKMTCQTDLKNLFYSLKKTKVFEQAIFKSLTLGDLKLLPEYQKQKLQMDIWDFHQFEYDGEIAGNDSLLKNQIQSKIMKCKIKESSENFDETDFP